MLTLNLHSNCEESSFTKITIKILKSFAAINVFHEKKNCYEGYYCIFMHVTWELAAVCTLSHFQAKSEGICLQPIFLQWLPYTEVLLQQVSAFYKLTPLLLSYLGFRFVESLFWSRRTCEGLDIMWKFFVLKCGSLYNNTEVATSLEAS